MCSKSLIPETLPQFTCFSVRLTPWIHSCPHINTASMLSTLHSSHLAPARQSLVYTNLLSDTQTIIHVFSCLMTTILLWRISLITRMPAVCKQFSTFASTIISQLLSINIQCLLKLKFADQTANAAAIVARSLMNHFLPNETISHRT